MGVSSSMNKKGWTDPSGRKGKVLVVQPTAGAQQWLLSLQPAPGDLAGLGEQSVSLVLENS